MLRQRKNMLQKRKDIVMKERKEKMIGRKKKEKIINNECSSWQTPPEDVMENIIRLVDFADQRRLGQVSKSWRSFIFQTFMRRTCHQLPWLVLPAESPASRINKYLSFLSFSENKISDGKVVKLKLPKNFQGARIYGCHKGWLIIVREKGLKSEMCLLNPILGIVHKLPPLRTVSSFKNYIKTRDWETLGVNGFYQIVRLCSTSNDFYSSSNIIVAAVLDDDRKTINLCRPGDEKWCEIPALDFHIDDILFSSGTLYVLVWDQQIEGCVAPSLTLDFALDDAECLKLKVVFGVKDDSIVDTDDRDYEIIPEAVHISRLLESNNKDVLICHMIFDYDPNVEGGSGDIEVDVNSSNANFRTRSFKTYKIDCEKNQIHMIQSLGDQSLFYGDDRVFSLPTSKITEQAGNNCVYFARNGDRKEGVYTDDDFGIFYLNGERIEWLFQGMQVSAKYNPCWFTPSL